MMKYLLSLGLCLAIAAAAPAQLTTENGAKSDKINIKIHEVDMLLQVLPLLLTKDQINNDVLPAIEVARQIEHKQLVYEDSVLAKLEPILDESLSDAYSKGAYPKKATVDEVAKATGQIGKQRLIVEIEMIDTITNMLNKTLNAGQRKALINSFDPKFIDPSIKPENMTDDVKINFFVRRVFLDPITYEIFKKMGKA